MDLATLEQLLDLMRQMLRPNPSTKFFEIFDQILRPNLKGSVYRVYAYEMKIGRKKDVNFRKFEGPGAHSVGHFANHLVEDLVEDLIEFGRTIGRSRSDACGYQSV